MKPALPPPEIIVANALRTAIPTFFSFPHLDANLKKIVAKYRRYDLDVDASRMAA